jgi:cytochrome c oxidase subunit IV
VSASVRAESLKNDLVVYAAILAISGLQIVVAYRGGPVDRRIIEMLSLAFAQAGLGVLFFMHLLQEKRALMLTLIPAALFVLLVMNAIWSDSFRIVHPGPN